jgi:hypothetical protein
LLRAVPSVLIRSQLEIFLRRTVTFSEASCVERLDE